MRKHSAPETTGQACKKEAAQEGTQRSMPCHILRMAAWHGAHVAGGHRK